MDNIKASVYNTMYTVKVPKISVYTDFDFDLVGIPLDVVDGEVTETNHQETMVVCLPIIELAKKASKGYSISLVDASEIKTLYEDLEYYIHQRGSNSSFRVNYGSGSEDDLVLLDAFAESILSLNDSKSLIKEIPTGFLKLKIGSSIPLLNKKPVIKESHEIKRTGYQPPRSISFNDYDKNK